MRGPRYYFTRLFYIIAGLRISKWRKHIVEFWSLEREEQVRAFEDFLLTHKPLNADGVPISASGDVYTSPVLTKSAYRESDLTASASGTFNRKTSGTTGEPTKITLRREELSRMLGVRDYCFSHYGVSLGDREARFWARADGGVKSRLKNFVLNRKVCFPVGEDACKSVTKILSWKPDYLYGYASLLLEAAVLVEKYNIKFTPPKCVVCTAETIMPAQKEYLAMVFNAPVAEEYGATEFDILAFECRNGHRHLVNPWLLVRDHQGTLLVTDISRRSANLVNYEIGDSGTVGVSECALLGGAEYLSVLEGRSIHRFVYVTPETRFHSVDLAYAINEYQRLEREIFSFRLIQSKYGVVDIYVSAEPLSGCAAFKDYIERKICGRTGNDIVINIYVGVKPEQQAEKSYFVQKIQQPAREVALT